MILENPFNLIRETYEAYAPPDSPPYEDWDYEAHRLAAEAYLEAHYAGYSRSQ